MEGRKREKEDGTQLLFWDNRIYFCLSTVSKIELFIGVISGPRKKKKKKTVGKFRSRSNGVCYKIRSTSHVLKILKLRI